MITTLSEQEVLAIFSIADQIMPVDNDRLSPLLSNMKSQSLTSGELLFRAGESNDAEYFVLNGLLRTFAISHDGMDVTLGFYRGPGILCPSITRSIEGLSRIHCEALSDTVAVSFPFSSLVNLMQQDDAVQRWGDTVLRNDLLTRAQREWALATMSGAHRLAQFRQEYGDLEQFVPHHKIASFLGITPVTLSRLRNTN